VLEGEKQAIAAIIDTGKILIFIDDPLIL